MYVRIKKKILFLSWQIFSISNKLNMKQMVEISINVIYPKYYKHWIKSCTFAVFGPIAKFLLKYATFESVFFMF